MVEVQLFCHDQNLAEAKKVYVAEGVAVENTTMKSVPLQKPSRDPTLPTISPLFKMPNLLEVVQNGGLLTTAKPDAAATPTAAAISDSTAAAISDDAAAAIVGANIEPSLPSDFES